MNDKEEKSLLLYLEDCLVNNSGKVTGAKMNQTDFDIAKKWKEERIIDLQRIPFHDINKNKSFPETHTVRFSNKAWELAHKFRRERAERVIDTISKWETLEITKGQERFWIGVLDDKGVATKGFCYFSGMAMLPPDLVLFKTRKLAEKVLNENKDKDKKYYKIHSSKDIRVCHYPIMYIDSFEQWEKL